MSIKQCCTLCCSPCSEYKLLQNKADESNEIYEITVKYFDPMLLTEANNLSHLKVLCKDCWHHIKDFHDFQETVLKTRISWSDKSNFTQLQAFPEVKIENEYHVIQPVYDEKDDDCKTDEEDDIFDDSNPHNTESCDLKSETLSNSDENSLDSILNKSQPRHTEQNTLSNTVLEKNACTDDVIKQQATKSRRGRKHKNSPKYDSKNTKETTAKEKKRKTKQSVSKKKEKGISAFNMEKAKEFDSFIAEWKPELVCDICSETHTNFDKLRKHFKEKHTTRFYIKCCERKFFRRFLLANHIRLHLNPETHKCDICGKSSSTKHNLKLHKKVVHEDTKQLKCDICEKLFKQKVTLDRHLLTHATGNKDFICTECGKGYVAERLLKLHITHVHNVDCVCDQCGKTIHGQHALKRHLLEHAGVERLEFTCDMCGVKLRSHNGLKRHKAAYHNDGTTIYVCGVCGKVANSENALRNHKKLVHDEERKYKCTYCNKAFKWPKTLREHIATHTGQNLYQCPHCPKTFKVSSNMYRHRKRVHTTQWEEGRKNRLQYPKVNINEVKKQVVI